MSLTRGSGAVHPGLTSPGRQRAFRTWKDQVIVALSALPQDVLDANGPIPAVGDDLIHPYKPGPRLWMAHCHNGGCGAYIDDQDAVPARDLLCDRCEQAGHDEE